MATESPEVRGSYWRPRLVYPSPFPTFVGSRVTAKDRMIDGFHGLGFGVTYCGILGGMSYGLWIRSYKLRVMSYMGYMHYDKL